MLKCEMCLGRTLRGEMSVLRSVDRSIEYEAGTAIEITDDTHRINVKVDGITVKVNANGNLSVDIPDIYAITAILETLSRYPLDHNYSDLRPLVPNGINQGKWATETVGANNKPIFMNQGVITASNANIGTNTKPVYMEGGEIKNSTANVGANNNPIFMNQGVITPSNANIGAANKPIHMENGVIKASGANVGTSSKPMYMTGGVLTPCDNTLDVNISGNATNDALAQKIDETYLKAVSVGADGTFTITRGDGQTTTFSDVKDLINAINLELEQFEQNYVKRTPYDLTANPMVYAGSTTYSLAASGSSYSNNISYTDSNHNDITFTVVPCAELSYDSSKTYYRFDVTTGDYVVDSSVSALNYTGDRNGLYYIYNYGTMQTFEEMVTAQALYIRQSAVSGDWKSEDYEILSHTYHHTNNPIDTSKSGMKHSGVLTAISGWNEHLSIYDVTTNQMLTYDSKRDRYGQGNNTCSVMVIKGHDYKVTGWSQVSIAFFGD